MEDYVTYGAGCALLLVMFAVAAAVAYLAVRESGRRGEELLGQRLELAYQEEQSKVANAAWRVAQAERDAALGDRDQVLANREVLLQAVKAELQAKLDAESGLRRESDQARSNLSDQVQRLERGQVNCRTSGCTGRSEWCTTCLKEHSDLPPPLQLPGVDYGHDRKLDEPGRYYPGGRPC